MFKLFFTSLMLLLTTSSMAFVVPVSPPIPLGSGITASDMAFLAQSLNPNQLKILNYCMASKVVKNRTPAQAYVMCRKLSYSAGSYAGSQQQLNKILEALVDAK